MGRWLIFTSTHSSFGPSGFNSSYFHFGITSSISSKIGYQRSEMVPKDDRLLKFHKPHMTMIYVTKPSNACQYHKKWMKPLVGIQHTRHDTNETNDFILYLQL